MHATVTPFTSRYRSDRRGRPWRTRSGLEVRVEAGPAVYTLIVGDDVDEEDLTNGHYLNFTGVEYYAHNEPPAEVRSAAREALRRYVARSRG